MVLIITVCSPADGIVAAVRLTIDTSKVLIVYHEGKETGWRTNIMAFVSPGTNYFFSIGL
jgi:hypothetical protein